MLEPLPAARSEYFYDEAHGDSDEPVYFDEDDPIQVEAAAAGAIAAPNPFVGIGPRTVVRSFAVWGAALAGHPMRLAGQAARLATDSLTALSGPPPGTVDRRFAHPAWQNVLPYRLLAREYLVLRDAIYESVERSGLKGDDAERARFAAALLAEALAPTNNLLLNPAGAERLWRTRGTSLLHGATNLLDDVRTNGGMPAVSQRDAFTVGRDLAATPGQVIYRSDLCELIQFNPKTAQVREIPSLMIPSPVNKYYFLDLAPGRSLVEHAVKAGLQFFTISWRNPTRAQRDWGVEHYVRAVEEALEVIAEVTGTDETNLLGVCAGGLISSIVNARRVARGLPIGPASTYLVSGIDSSWPTTFGALAGTRAATLAVRRTQRAGMLPGRDISRAFAWMRPNELLWGLWVNNYVLGKRAPSTDILFWNSDLTNLPARFHGEQVEALVTNPYAEAGRVSVLGTPIDLSTLANDSYFLGAQHDHIVPWQACYRSARLVGGSVRFVAASGGHIQCLVSPPRNLKARYLVADELPQQPGLPDDPGEWMQNATEHRGTWWTDWTTWLVDRSGGLRRAPRRSGSDDHPAIQAAPGRYVHQRA